MKNQDNLTPIIVEVRAEKSPTLDLFKQAGIRSILGSQCVQNDTRYFAILCRYAQQKKLITFAKRQVNKFLEEGFCNWKKVLQKLDEHDRSEMHREAVLKYAAHSSGTDVCIQLNQQHITAQQHHKMLLKLLSSIQFLTRQGLALRGHREDANHMDGNLYKLILLRSEECPELKSWLSNREYVSPEIVNELIKIMGNSVLRGILSNIKSNSSFFSIIADEATDVSRNEQMSLSIRWVDDEYAVYEECIGFMQLPDTKAHTIFTCIKDLLIRCSLPLSQCRGQAFDGASNMSGIRNGVQALIKREEEHALYVHCLAHNLLHSKHHKAITIDEKCYGIPV